MKKITVIVGLLAAAPAIFSTQSPAAPNGGAVYSTNCAFCHQAGGVGVQGQFPRLESRAGVIAATPEGRKFLITVLLNGMSGRVTVDGQDVLGLMPGFATMNEADMAAVLTYISHLGKGNAKVAPFTAKDIADARSNPVLAPDEVALRRANLAAANIIP